MSTYKIDKENSKKEVNSLDVKIQHLVKTKRDIEKKENKPSTFDPVTKKDLENLQFVDDLSKLKAIQREKLLEDLSTLLNDKIRELEQKDNENKEKEKVLSDLTIALDEKIKELKTKNLQLQEEKKRADDLNENLKTTLKKLREAELELKVERDWLAEQVEKKSLEVLQTIDQLMKAEKSKK